MLPTIFSYGPFSVSAFGFFLALAFITGAFIIWKHTRNVGMDTEKVFDHLIVTAFAAFIGARSLFIIEHPDVFSVNWLRIPLIWKFPGISVWGALIIGGITFFLLSRKLKLAVGHLADSYGYALPIVALLMSLGVFFDGSIIGLPTSWFTGLPAVGVVGKRHPVGLYALIIFFIVLCIYQILQKKISGSKLPSGVIGWLSLSILGLAELLLATFRADLLYFRGIAVDMILGGLLMFIPCIPLIILLNGKEKIFAAVSYYKNKFRPKNI